MDKTLQEEIAQELARQDDELIWEHLKPAPQALFLLEANQLLSLIIERVKEIQCPFQDTLSHMDGRYCLHCGAIRAMIKELGG